MLAVVALTGGISKAFVPKEKLVEAPAGGWTEDAGVGFVTTLGVLELLAAVGLILPLVFRSSGAVAGPGRGGHAGDEWFTDLGV